MVFWVGGEKRTYQLISCNRVENICFDLENTTKSKLEQVIRRIILLGGTAVLNHVAIKKRKYIYIYKLGKINVIKGTRLLKRLKIVSEEDDFYTMPNSVVTASNNKEFIRELILSGRKVSWYNPDLNLHLNTILMFDFEFLFLDSCLDDKMIHPNGYVMNVKSESKKIDGYDFFGKINSPPLAKTIGYNNAEFNRRFPYNNRYYIMWKYNLFCKGSFKYLFVDRTLHYYNFLAISYILWNKSIATTVRKKSVKKG